VTDALDPPEEPATDSGSGIESEPPSAPPADPEEEPPPPFVSRREKRFEVVATLILAVTALATAWSGYQASLWDGIQSSNYTQASAARTEAAQLRTEANQYRLADLTLFENFVDATIDEDERLAAFYRERFRPEFEVAFDAWLELDPFVDAAAPASPLAMPEYQLADDADADALDARADTLFREGEDANTFSDVYTMSTLLLAITLFFAAISERFEYVRVRVALLALGALGLIAGIVVAFGQPITAG
jgi:hypothetical protein